MAVFTQLGHIYGRGLGARIFLGSLIGRELQLDYYFGALIIHYFIQSVGSSFSLLFRIKASPPQIHQNLSHLPSFCSRLTLSRFSSFGLHLGGVILGLNIWKQFVVAVIWKLIWISVFGTVGLILCDAFDYYVNLQFLIVINSSLTFAHQCQSVVNSVFS